MNLRSPSCFLLPSGISSEEEIMALKAVLLTDLKKLQTGFKPALLKAWSYAKVELAPPLPTDLPQVKGDITRLVAKYKDGSWRNTTVKDAWRNILVGIEICSWFFIGECIGKGGLIGYDV